jgi:hypothetical protein
MPTILNEDGYRFFFYSADYLEPMHVHVEHGDGEAKFWLRPVQLASNYRFRSQELKKARLLIEKNQKLFEEKWNEYFSKK